MCVQAGDARLLRRLCLSRPAARLGSLLPVLHDGPAEAMQGVPAQCKACYAGKADLSRNFARLPEAHQFEPAFAAVEQKCKLSVLCMHANVLMS